MKLFLLAAALFAGTVLFAQQPPHSGAKATRADTRTLELQKEYFDKVPQNK